jgi:hypothetical protein
MKERNMTHARMRLTAVAAAALVVALGAAPMLARSADHLDAPGLLPPSGRLDADINDVFAFEASDPGRTVLAVTTHPLAGALSPLTYATDVNYTINVDRTHDAVQDLAYVFRFRAASGGSQAYTVTRYTGSNARTLAQGVVLGAGNTGTSTSMKNDSRVFAGLRSDPFFFDLAAFRGAVLGIANGRTFCDQPGGTGIDFFQPANTNALVVEVPDDTLGGRIGVWATTSDASGQVDRMGRPAINTVFNAGEDKNAFNHGVPSDDFADFSDNVIGVLKTFSGLDSEGAYTDAQAAGLAHVLLPDVLTYDTSTAAAGPLNGRALTDDVIDVELNIVTGGYPFAGRDGDGAIGGDCVGPHHDLLSSFPYLGMPH